jgi:serine/threonine protein kinase
VKKKGRVPVADAVAIIRQSLEALDFIHGRGYIHRDFKPANLLLKDGPDGPIDARLADFGLAKPLQEAGFSRISFSGEAKGSLGFMPPEQITDSKSAGAPADIYAAGATLHYLITGRRAFDGTGPHDLILKILEEPAPRLEGVPAGLADLVARALAKHPADRPSSARAFRDALAPFE